MTTMIINFCTTVKNRTWQLKQTLSENMFYIRKHSNTKILILNYNSEDDLNTYLTTYFLPDIISGQIEYYILNDVKDSFDMSYAKNLIHTQVKEGVVFNLDADNFINNVLIKELSMLKDNELLIPYQGSDVTHKGFRDTGRCGRLGLTLNSFNKLKGYDESIKGLGGDDGNLVRRAINHGFKLIKSEEKSLPIPNYEESKIKNITKESMGSLESVILNGYGIGNVTRF